MVAYSFAKDSVFRTGYNKVKWWFILFFGLIQFTKTQQTSDEVYQKMISLHCMTNGFATKLLGKIFSIVNPKKKIQDCVGILGNLSVSDINSIAKQIEENGYYVFEKKLPETICAVLEQYALNTPANLEGRWGTGQGEKAIFNPNEIPKSYTYRLAEENSIQNSTIQDLMADKTIRNVVATYISANPILCSVNLWWSSIMGGKPGADAAQLYHFDMSRAKWLNFFIYLTDVDSNGGPHCVVKKSHHFKNKKGFDLLKRGYVRISDEDIELAYGKENMIEICGKRGTILAVDTKCFHKGKPPISQHRLMFELVYASSLFGGQYTTLKKPKQMTEKLNLAFKENPGTYRRYL